MTIQRRAMLKANMRYIMVISILALFLIIPLCLGHAQELKDTVNASQLYENLSMGSDINLTDVIVNGSLDIDNLRNVSIKSSIKYSPDNISIIIHNKIIIRNSFINGDIDFSHTIFEDDVDFEDTIFNGTIDLSESVFQKKANFFESNFNKVFISNAIFLDIADFSNAIFIGDADFDNSEFKSNSKFDNAIFKGELVNFQFSKFDDKTEFIDAQFEEQADFSDVIFEKSAGFWYSNFTYAIFKKSIFKDDAYFGSCKFFQDADFSSSSFEKDAYFGSAIFHNNLNLIGSIFRQNAYFENITLDDMSRIAFDDNTHFNRLLLKWDIINTHFDYNDDIYQRLRSNYKDLGWIEDANNCYYVYRDESRKEFCKADIDWNNPFNAFMTCLARTLDWLNMFVYGYGVRPESPLRLIPFILIIFALYFKIVDNKGFIDALSFSITVFLSGSGRLFVEAPKYEPAPWNSQAIRQFSRVMFNCERLLGMIIFVAMIIAIGNTMWRV